MTGSPDLFVLAGPDGAGRTTFFEHVLAPMGLDFINADGIAALRWPGYEERHAYVAADEAARLRSHYLADRRSFVPPFDDAVWSGDIGTVLAPVESEFGFHIIEVTASDTTPASELSSEQLRALSGAELEEVITAALQAATVTVDPAIGIWDPMIGAITPAS